MEKNSPKIFSPQYIKLFSLFWTCMLLLWASQVVLVVKNLTAKAGDVRDSG